MGAVWRILAGIFGVALGLLILGGADAFIPGFWSPLALSVAITAILCSQPWLTKRGLAGWTSSAIGFGVCAGYLASDGFTNRLIDFEYLPALLLEAIALLSLAIVIGRVLRIPVKDRAPGWWMVALIVMGWCVSVGSSAAGGADHMIAFFEHFGVARHDAQSVVAVLRKTIHFCFYGSLGLFARKTALSAKEKPESAWKFALLLALAVSCFDESRQISISSRGASVYDVMLDLSGAITFNLLSTWRASRQKTKA